MLFALNKAALFNGLGWQDAMELAEKYGFDRLETWTFPDEEVRVVQALMQQDRMKLAGLCPDEFILNDPAKYEDYERALLHALDKLVLLDGTHIITQVGDDNGMPLEDQIKATTNGLRQIAPSMESKDKVLVVEPLNTHKEHPNAWLDGSDICADILIDVGSPYVKMLYDVYHMLHMGEDVYTQIAKHWDLIDYIHFAGFPLRNQDLQIGFDYRALLKWLKKEGFRGTIGFEMMPDEGITMDQTLSMLQELVSEI
ncbi:sugar phosphate isomerase/epimerase [Eubacteriales bacterium OttesenSCG-928-N13]|nr:sugar phosphate isomerase/epimerase [Eubacteriales bacterium OttesenSCG-928-N13]